MAFLSTTIITVLSALCITTLIKFASEKPNKSSFETYIVHVEAPDDLSELEDLERWYRSFLPPATTGEEEAELIYSYRHVMKGFAARLTPEQVKNMEKKVGFIAARPEEIPSLDTTHSPSFLELNQNTGFWEDSKYGEGVIIGVIDTGIFPDHPSFRNESMPRPPAKWKGKCEFNITCNNKLIGARYFASGQGTPNDEDGHGTHVASIAAGNFIAGANSFEQANGTAAGIAPRAHLAIYKARAESDVLMAIETAIEDGVDVLSISMGFGRKPFNFDGIAIGSYAAMKKGIFVSCSAGNEGPSSFTLNKAAPWYLTVGASTIDRKLRVVVVLGNNEVSVGGEAIWQQREFSKTPLPLSYIDLCISWALIDVGGKIVACGAIGEGINTIIAAAKEANASAVILMNSESQGATKILVPVQFPMAQVSYAGGTRIKDYINSTASPEATLWFEGTVIGDDRAQTVASNWTATLSFNETLIGEDVAQTVAYFSSRGPSMQSPGILKPDILGPGVNILAAAPSKDGKNNRFVFMSGTSMACPHLSGVAALLKRNHTDWSPATIKSAIMTTADVMNRAGVPTQDQTLKPANVFATGAGHVNISRASNPGLVYNLTAWDYIPYLCGLQYTEIEIYTITQEKVNCSKIFSISESQLNYPSFSIIFGSHVQNQSYTRTVTNVGEANSSYHVEISKPDGVDVLVEPETLNFTRRGETQKYKVTFSLRPDLHKFDDYSEGSLTWSSTLTKYNVRSPIVAIMENWLP